MIVLMVFVGGLTRLTGSGLSMVDWEPLSGMIPPITQKAWALEFEAYKQYPQYKILNQGMGLSEFKWIFFWEYLHRMMGRFLGLLCLVPTLLFWLKFDNKMRGRSLLFVVLVVMQGLLGWYMVKSGLLNAPRVSHFRLTSHLSLAFLFFLVVYWSYLDIRGTLRRPHPKIFAFGIGVSVLTVLQMIYGGFMAGLKAGYGFNTFPKMGDTWMSPAVFFLETTWHNFVMNPFMVQFIHRWLGILLLFVILLQWRLFKEQVLLKWIAGVASLQVLLGIITLVWVVPIVPAVLHQLLGLVLLTSVVTQLYIFRTRFN